MQPSHSSAEEPSPAPAVADVESARWALLIVVLCDPSLELSQAARRMLWFTQVWGMSPRRASHLAGVRRGDAYRAWRDEAKGLLE